jgi:hypothetical protein
MRSAHINCVCRFLSAGLSAGLALGCVSRGTPTDAGAASSSASAVSSPAQSAVRPAASAAPTASSHASSAPLRESDCKACNGVWKIHGLSQKPSCNCRTRDAGVRCRDGDECQGQCVAAERPEQEITEPGPPARGHFIGRCSELVTVFGCHRFIPRGASAAGAVDLSVPPRKICFD